MRSYKYTFWGFVSELANLMDDYSSRAERFEMSEKDDLLCGELMYEIDMAVDRVVDTKIKKRKVDNDNL